MIPPEEEPVAKTFFGSALYLEMVYLTMLTMERESEPPL